MTSRKRILFAVPGFKLGAGGAERVVATLLRHIDHGRYDCHLALAQTPQGYFEGLPAEVTVHQLHASRMRYALPGIIRLAWKLRPQTTLATVSYLNLMLAAARPFLPSGTRLLLQEATTPSTSIRMSARYPRLWRLAYRHLYPRADIIVCLSDSMLEDMAVHFAIPRHKLVRIYNPVDVVALRRLAATMENPYKGQGPFLLFAGRLQREKGADILLDAMPLLIQRYPGIRLNVLGEGPEEPLLTAQVARLGIQHHVEFQGFRQAPWAWFSHADAFVLPSRVEGLPNALLEAIALGAPVVASSCVGGILEIQATNPQMVIVEPESPRALAEGIISALQKAKDHCRSMEKAIERLRPFEVNEVVEQYSALLDER